MRGRCRGRRTRLPAWAAVLFPPGHSVVLVAQPDRSGRHPPLDCSTERRVTAPAIGVAAAVTIPRVMDALQNAACHLTSLAPPHASLRRLPCAYEAATGAGASVVMGPAGGSAPDRSPLHGLSDRLWHPHAAPCAAVLECQPEPSAERTPMSTRAKVVQPRPVRLPGWDPRQVGGTQTSVARTRDGRSRSKRLLPGDRRATSHGPHRDDGPVPRCRISSLGREPDDVTVEVDRRRLIGGGLGDFAGGVP
jgi:hypothetical protein